MTNQEVAIVWEEGLLIALGWPGSHHIFGIYWKVFPVPFFPLVHKLTKGSYKKEDMAQVPILVSFCKKESIDMFKGKTQMTLSTMLYNI